MRNLLSGTLTVLIGILFICGPGCSPANAQSDDSIIRGGIRLYEKWPTPAAQNARCRDPLTRLLGRGMSFVGVEPWVTNHPLLERNCVTLLEIYPLAAGPHVDEMLGAPNSWWSRVVRVRIPDNGFGWQEGYGFAWCSDRSCSRNILTLFSDTQLIGFCSAYGKGRATRYAITNLGDDTAVTAVTPYRSCVDDPRATTELIAGTDRLPDARRFTAPTVTVDTAASGGDSGRGQAEINQSAGADRDYAETVMREQQRAAQQWQRLQQPNELGW